MADGEDGNLGGLGEKDRINIILEEYKAPRAEVVARTTMQAQLNAAFCAGVITVIGVMLANHVVIIGSIMIVLLLGLWYLVSISLNEDTRNIGQRLLEIEAEINRRAGAGERLFSWESRFGIGQLSTAGLLARTVRRVFWH